MPTYWLGSKDDVRKKLREDNNGGPITHRQIDQELGVVMSHADGIRRNDEPYRGDSIDIRSAILKSKELVRANQIIAWLLTFKQELVDLGYTEDLENGVRRKKDRYEPTIAE